MELLMDFFPLIIIIIVIILGYIYHLRIKNKSLNSQNVELFNINRLMRKDFKGLLEQQQQLLNNSNNYLQKNISDKTRVGNTNVILKEKIKTLKSELEEKSFQIFILNKKITSLENAITQIKRDYENLIELIRKEINETRIGNTNVILKEKHKHAFDEANITLNQKNEAFPAPGWDNEEDRLSYSELTKEDRIKVHKNK